MHEKIFWVGYTLLTLLTVFATGAAAYYAKGAYEQAKAQNDAATTPYIYAAVDDVSAFRRLYRSADFFMDDETAKIHYVDFGQTPAMLIRAQCAIFIGYGVDLSADVESAYVGLDPTKAVRMPYFAPMIFRNVGESTHTLPAAPNSPTQPFVCSRGIANALAFTRLNLRQTD